MNVLRSVKAYEEYRKDIKGTVGFVPTMGALHLGHQTLLQQARQENDHVVLSIFVNPTQFNNPDDLKKYPRTFEADLEIAKAARVDAVFSPEYAEMYPDNYKYTVSENSFSRILCGATRPGHFDGVLSVVMKLFNITQADRAYFGEKDFQQLLLIEEMVKAFFLAIEIKRVATIREQDGLAMSSRNVRLTAEQRKIAPLIYQTLKSPSSLEEKKQILTQAGFKIDYLEKHLNRIFVAAFLGDVRLIDNVAQ